MTIKSLHYDYDVTFDQSAGEIHAYLAKYPHKVVVIDERVHDLYNGLLSPQLADLPIYRVVASENTKTLDGVQNLLNWLLENKCNRSTTVIGIGGGIVQDLVTFTSNIFYRGASFVLVPTTLLSMCDSCIGAKCGINYGNFKNQLGVIHAPKGVHIFGEFLNTLEDREVKSGYGEILKLAITGSTEAFNLLVHQVRTHGLRGDHVLGMIKQSLEIKKGIIEEDEYEKDLRRVLNYGHTFGHALEALTHHAIPHGLAVAWGIDVVNFLQLERNPNLQSLYERTHEFIRTHLTFKLDAFPSPQDLVEMTKRDKKMQGSTLNLAVPTDFGALSIEATSVDQSLVESVERYLNTSNVYG
jgi:3-dehydroquinate synthase